MKNITFGQSKASRAALMARSQSLEVAY